MNGFFGADTGALRDYAQRLQTGSGRLLELRSSLATQPSEPAPKVPQRLPGLKRDEQS